MISKRARSFWRYTRWKSRCGAHRIDFAPPRCMPVESKLPNAGAPYTFLCSQDMSKSFIACCARGAGGAQKLHAQQLTKCLSHFAVAQVHTEQKNSKKLKELYGCALAVKSAIPHPRIMGIIRECGGKMHMHERAWSDAATDFFEVLHALNF